MVTEIVQVSSTTDSRESAEQIARAVVEARVAACAQVVGPIRSTYWWEGKVENEEEFLILAKTTADGAERLVEHIRKVHSYDVPEVIVTPVTGGNPAYLDWVATETAAAGAG